MIKEEELKALYDEYTCQFSDKEIVLGEGNPDSRILLVGEAPGKDEVKQLRPFVGTAGKNLNEFLEILGIGRDSIYITNAIKYRLSRRNSDTGRISNRPATKDEVEGNRHYLIKEIEAISPNIIVTLGNVPLRAVTGNYGVSIGTMHGRPEEIEIAGSTYKIYALYHPASIIYNRSLKTVYMEDLHKLHSWLNL